MKGSCQQGTPPEKKALKVFSSPGTPPWTVSLKLFAKETPNVFHSYINKLFSQQNTSVLWTVFKGKKLLSIL